MNSHIPGGGWDLAKAGGGGDIIWVPLCAWSVLVISQDQDDKGPVITVDPGISGDGGVDSQDGEARCSGCWQTAALSSDSRRLTLKIPNGSDGRNGLPSRYFVHQLGIISKTPILVY